MDDVPPSLRQAVADFSAQRLPGAQLPDLSATRSAPVTAGGVSGKVLDGVRRRGRQHDRGHEVPADTVAQG